MSDATLAPGGDRPVDTDEFLDAVRARRAKRRGSRIKPMRVLLHGFLITMAIPRASDRMGIRATSGNSAVMSGRSSGW